MSDPVPLHVAASFSATELNKSGAKLLDTALSGPVRITRRDQRFVLLREDALVELLADAQDESPKSLDDLLRHYDGGKIKARTRAFLDDPPAGKEPI